MFATRFSFRTASFTAASAALLLLSACAQKEVKPEAKVATVQAAVIDIPTSKCASCEKTITKALQSIDGVTDVKVDSKTHKAEMKYADDKTNLDKIRAGIAKAGYTADGVTRDSAAYAGLDECCK